MPQQLVRDVTALVGSYGRMADDADAHAQRHRAAGRRLEANIAEMLATTYRDFVRDLVAGEFTS